MFATDGAPLRDILVSLAIALPIFLAAGLFYFSLRHAARRMAARTGTALDNMLLASLERPLVVGIILSGMYFGLLHLPFKESIEFEIRRGFYVAFFFLAAYGGISLVSSVLRWFKLEVTSRTYTVIDDWIIALLRVIVPALAGLLVLLASLGQFGIETNAVKDWLVVHGTRIALVTSLAILVLFIISLAGAKAIRAFVARGRPGQPEEEIDKRAKTLTRVVVTGGQIFVVVIAAFIILSELGIDIAPILAGAGVVGIAIGFGAQGLVRDLLAGLFIVMENQYRVGDVVKIADVSGLVEEINLRRTVLRDMDGVVWVVPNGEIKVAGNFTKELSRVNLNISVGYGTDLDHAISVIDRVCEGMAKEPEWAPLITATPKVLRVDSLGDSGIDLKIVGETKPIRQWDVMGEIRKRLKKAFDEEGIEIPWPHTKVYFGNPIPTLPPQPPEDGPKGDHAG